MFTGAKNSIAIFGREHFFKAYLAGLVKQEHLISKRYDLDAYRDDFLNHEYDEPLRNHSGAELVAFIPDLQKIHDLVIEHYPDTKVIYAWTEGQHLGERIYIPKSRQYVSINIAVPIDNFETLAKTLI